MLLVEGIAEALLLPVIAEHHTLKDAPDKLQIFRSAVFVPIDGVDFLPYADLLTTPLNGARISERVVVMTDGDKGKIKKKGETANEGSEEIEDGDDDAETIPLNSIEEDQSSEDTKIALLPGGRRKAALNRLAMKNKASECLTAITSTYTLETEMLEVGNAAILRKAFLTLHKNSAKKWDMAVLLEGDARAEKLDEIFNASRKGDFAQILADLIESNDPKYPFTVPKYIEDAILAVVA